MKQITPSEFLAFLMFAGSLAAVFPGQFAQAAPDVSTSAKPLTTRKWLIADRKTERFIEKEGFERQKKDIVNTLKDNEVTRFTTLQDALVQAFDLDKTLKNRGPFTLFAPSDRGFKQIPSDDLQALMANKKKLRQVLEYHIVEGQLNSDALKNRKTLKTMEGHDLTISERGGNIYADNVLIKTVDLPCSNGIIHVLDGVVMPPLSK